MEVNRVVFDCEASGGTMLRVAEGDEFRGIEGAVIETPNASRGSVEGRSIPFPSRLGGSG